MPQRKNKKHYTVYLIKESITDAKDILEVNSLKNFPLKKTSNYSGALFVKPQFGKEPKWRKLFRDEILEVPINLQLQSASSSAVLLLKVKNRIFAFTFGFGWSLLDQNSIEENFGLKIALNLIETDKIVSIDRKTIDGNVQHTITQSSQQTDFGTFGMDVEKDILRGITGEPKDVKTFGKKIAGSTSLKIQSELDIENLYELCGLLDKEIKNKLYIERYPWIDQLSEVKNPQKNAELNQMLESAFQNKNYGKLFLAIPEIVDWNSIEGFIFNDGEDLHDDIHIDLIRNNASIDSQIITIPKLKRLPVAIKFVNNEFPVKKWSIYDCINYEISQGEEVYILNGGKWYLVKKQFATSINVDLKGYFKEFSEFTLPNYDHKNEEEYNKDVCLKNPTEYFLMDRKNIHIGGGRNKVEFCDIYSHKKHLFFIKRYSTSSVMSHLLSQAIVTATLLRSSPQFVALVNKQLGSSFKLSKVIEPSEYKIIYGVISSSNQSLFDLLPFFTKINLLSNLKSLSLFGFPTFLQKISDVKNKKNHAGARP